MASASIQTEMSIKEISRMERGREKALTSTLDKKSSLLVLQRVSHMENVKLLQVTGMLSREGTPKVSLKSSHFEHCKLSFLKMLFNDSSINFYLSSL